MSTKPGWKTTEFWATIFAQLLSVSVLIGVLTPADSETIGSAITKSVEAVGVILANTAIVMGYLRSRTTLKAAAAANTDKIGYSGGKK